MSSSPYPKETQIPAEFALLAFDMEKYSKIPEVRMESTRSDVDDIIAGVLADCGLPDPQTLPHSYKDGGDGAILLFPPEVLARIIDPLLGRLSAALARYDQQRLASSPLVRLRVAVHAGPVTGPELRSGNALVDVSRLLDSQAVRKALQSAADTGGFLAGVLSETAYQRCVHGGYTPELAPLHFAQATARVSDKPGYQALCHLHVPGMPGAAITPYLDEEPDPGSPEAGAPAEPGPSGAAPSAASAAQGGGIQFHAPLYGATVGGHIERVRNTYPGR
ncbi:hypothetical protein ACWERY_10580 [Streptomyces sp. NPDC004082]|uniref:hypothetical protein n=1 Tax=unclassified Streptomyces TaxID=2593676 RepID=UPI0033AD13BB